MNNKGQSLVFFVALIPLLFIIFAFIFDTSLIIRENNRYMLKKRIYKMIKPKP